MLARTVCIANWGVGTAVLWLYHGCKAYQQQVFQKTNGAVTPSLDNFDAFMFGLSDPNECSVLNGMGLVLQHRYHSKLVVQHGWPAMETSTKID